MFLEALNILSAPYSPLLTVLPCAHPEEPNIEQTHSHWMQESSFSGYVAIKKKWTISLIMELPVDSVWNLRQKLEISS